MLLISWYGLTNELKLLEQSSMRNTVSQHVAYNKTKGEDEKNYEERWRPPTTGNMITGHFAPNPNTPPSESNLPSRDHIIPSNTILFQHCKSNLPRSWRWISHRWSVEVYCTVTLVCHGYWTEKSKIYPPYGDIQRWVSLKLVMQYVSRHFSPKKENVQVWTNNPWYLYLHIL